MWKLEAELNFIIQNNTSVQCETFNVVNPRLTSGGWKLVIEKLMQSYKSFTIDWHEDEARDVNKRLSNGNDIKAVSV